MKKKIFITGISSEIMTQFVSLIDFSNYEVTGLTRNPESFRLENVEIVKGDICNTESFGHYLEGCDIIIHAAAITHSFAEKPYYQINLEATKKLVGLAKEYAVKKFVFISSNTAGRESGSYGLTKMLAEEYLQKNLKKWTIIRPSEIYGGGKKEGIDKLINNVITKPFVLCPLGVSTKFYPIHIDDATQLMHLYSFDGEFGNKTTIVNGPEGFSFLEVIELAKTISKRRVRILFLKRWMMFLMKRIATILPFYIGVVPDQITRLYAVKKGEKSSEDLMKIESYIQKLVDTNRVGT